MDPSRRWVGYGVYHDDVGLTLGCLWLWCQLGDAAFEDQVFDQR